MEFYMTRRDQWERLYNCSRIDIDDVPLWERQQIVNGTIMLALFIIFESLYMPCLLAIWHNRVYPSYKFLFFIGITDILMLPIQGLASALYSLFGNVFCSNPSANYLIASCGAALFAAQSSANVFLALDRLVEMISSKYNAILFSGQRVWLWTLISAFFGFYYFWAVKPAVFSPTYGNWFMNPYQDYTYISIDFDEYVHPIVLYYDAILTFAFPAIYLLFIAGFLRELGLRRNNSVGTSPLPQRQQQAQQQQQPINSPPIISNTLTNNFVFPSEQRALRHTNVGGGHLAKIVFVQVAAINGINVLTFALYAIMQRLPISKSLIIVGFYCNYLMFGIPPIVYLLVNRTIRNECRKMIKKTIKI